MEFTNIQRLDATVTELHLRFPYNIYLFITYIIQSSLLSNATLTLCFDNFVPQSSHLISLFHRNILEQRYGKHHPNRKGTYCSTFTLYKQRFLFSIIRINICIYWESQANPPSHLCMLLVPGAG